MKMLHNSHSSEGWNPEKLVAKGQFTDFIHMTLGILIEHFHAGT